jgi:predicted ester cyclase
MRKTSLLLFLFVACIPALAQQPAEQERNKQIARSFFEEVLGQGHLDRYAESHSKDFVAHAGNHEATLEEDIAAAREERKALPDMRVTVNQMVAERDLVAVYWTAVGTNTQAGMGFPQRAKRSKLMA